MARQPAPRDRKTVTALIGVWFVLAIVAVLWGVPHIEQSLTIQAEAALADDSVAVRLSGRDARLITTGSPDQAEAARQKVASIDGIRQASVDVVASALEEVTVNPDTEQRPVEPVLEDPSLRVRAERGTFTLSGSVADDATAQAVSSAAIAGYGQERMTAEVSVQADTHSPAWLNDPFKLFSIVGSNDLGIEIYDKTMRITGVVPDETTRQQVVSELKAELDGVLDLVDRLVIVPIEEAVFTMESNGGSVTLRGILPSQGEVNSVRAAAEKIYGADSVATWLSVDPVAPAIPYLTDATSFFVAFEGRTLDFVDLGDTLAVRGSVPNEDIRNSIGDTLTQIVDPRGLINEIEVVAVDADTQAAIDAINDIIGASLNFASGSTALSDADRTKLDDVAEIFNGNPTLRAVVEGHTDDRSGALGNLRLSEERAGSVVTYLVDIGIDPDRLTTIGFGEARPIASNATSSGRAQNRRIEFNVEGSN